MNRAAVLGSVVLSGAIVSAGQMTPEPCTLFRVQMGLNDDQIAMVARGESVAKVLPSKTPAEIVVFGAVFVSAARRITSSSPSTWAGCRDCQFTWAPADSVIRPGSRVPVQLVMEKALIKIKQALEEGR